MSPSVPQTRGDAPKGAPLLTAVARHVDRPPAYTRQRIARGRPSVAHDLRARWPGTCQRCGRHFAAGTVVLWCISGIRHAVCPVGEPS